MALSDTHLESMPTGTRRGAPVRGGRLPDAALRLLEGAGGILHAGDVLDAGVLDVLEAMAPTWAVLGNNDRDLAGRLPGRRVVELAGVRIGMVHDAGPARGRPVRLRRWFPDAAVVVFGHTHAPLVEPGDGGQLLVNPGSPTQRRAQPHHTVATLDLEGGTVLDARIVVVDPPAP